jgi:hypothetical protein
MIERTRWGRVDADGKLSLCQVKPTTIEVAANPGTYVCQIVRIHPWVVPITNREKPGKPRCDHGIKDGSPCPLCRKEEACP